MSLTKTATRLLSAALCCALAAGAANAQGAKRGQTIERVVHVAPLAPNGARYLYVPFDVPRGASRVTVAYDYPREGGANTLDLGVFDARADGPGRGASGRGFRGWSGGRRPEFFISPEEATPGYLAGGLPAGRWRVVLGLYKVAPAGVDVKVRVTVETGRASPGRRAPVPGRAAGAAGRPDRPGRVAVAGEPRWFAGDLHMHTVHSDGDWTVPELAAAARRTGLDFIFVTDHNTASHHAEVDRANDGRLRPLVMRGEEVTTYGGHANAWGLPAGAFVDFRVRPGDAAGMAGVAASAHRLGALASVNHPFALCGGCDWSYGDAVEEFDGVEVWNGDWDATDESALRMWDGLLRRGLRPTAVASSDSHRALNPIGRPAAHVAAGELTQAALLDGIRRGRVYLARDARAHVLDFEAAAGELGSRGPRTGIGGEIRLAAPGTLTFFVRVGAATVAPEAPPGPVPRGAAVSLVSGGRAVRTWRADSLTEVFEVECERDGYYRLEVRDEAGAMVALTNPVYVKVGKRR